VTSRDPLIRGYRLDLRDPHACGKPWPQNLRCRIPLHNSYFPPFIWNVASRAMLPEGIVELLKVGPNSKIALCAGPDMSPNGKDVLPRIFSKSLIVISEAMINCASLVCTCVGRSAAFWAI
jgi:hypothetical protein